MSKREYEYSKACAFNTKMKTFFHQRGKNKEQTLMVYDMFGEAHEAKNIKMIITPSCLKFLKLKGKFGGSEQECFNYWLTHIDEEFGMATLCPLRICVRNVKYGNGMLNKMCKKCVSYFLTNV